jgi:hypothetical protein
VKVLICGLSSQTVIRSIGLKTTCGELKQQLGVIRLMSCGQMLKDDHTFFDNDVIHVLGRLRGGMEVNWDKMNQLPDISLIIVSLFLCLSRSRFLSSLFCAPLVVVSVCLCLSLFLCLFVFVFVSVFVPLYLCLCLCLS